MPRSSSIDSMVEAVWSEQIEAIPTLPSSVVEKRPSLRPDRPLTLVSPSVGRRMKGQRGINGTFILQLLNFSQVWIEFDKRKTIRIVNL